MKWPAYLASALLALQPMSVSAVSPSEPSRSSDATAEIEAHSALQTITLRVDGMMKSRSGAT